MPISSVLFAQVVLVGKVTFNNHAAGILITILIIL